MNIVVAKDLGVLWALKWAWPTFLCQSIGIVETNTFQLKFVGVRVGVTPCWNKLSLRKKLRSLHTKSQLSSFCSFRDLSVHPDGQTDGHGYMDSASDPYQEYIYFM